MKNNKEDKVIKKLVDIIVDINTKYDGIKEPYRFLILVGIFIVLSILPKALMLLSLIPLILIRIFYLTL